MRHLLEDFQVDEVPAYLPSGTGGHLFVRFEKTDLTTPAAVSLIAKALQVKSHTAGFAGLKARRGITRQWASFEGATPEQLSELTLPPNLRILEHGLHAHKLKTGHLKSNRFQIRVRNR